MTKFLVLVKFRPLPLNEVDFLRAKARGRPFSENERAMHDFIEPPLPREWCRLWFVWTLEIPCWAMLLLQSFFLGVEKYWSGENLNHSLSGCGIRFRREVALKNEAGISERSKIQNDFSGSVLVVWRWCS